MSYEPLVSVIIPAFNAQDFIAETSDSVLTQSYPNIEVIVIDDGSTDQTTQIVQSFGSKVRYFYQENSGGCSVPRNNGIKKSSGELICFMDADDLMTPDRIAKQADFMKRYSNVGLVFCDYRNFNENKVFPQSHFQTCPRLWPQLKCRSELILENPRALMAQENFGIAGSFLMRNELLRLESRFEPSLKSCEDFNFYFRLARHTLVGVINKVGMMHRVHGNNMSRNVLKMRLEGIRSRTMLREREKDPEVREWLDRYIANCKGDLARFHADHSLFLKSIQYDWKVLSGPFFWPETGRACRNIIRTILMAARLHKSGQKT